MVRFSVSEARYLEQQTVGRLATASKTAVPHIAPVCYASNFEKLFIHTGRESKKVKNIMENQRVAFVVDEYLGWGSFRGIMIQGHVEIVEGGKDFVAGRTLIYKKYPRWKETYPIVEGEDILLAVVPEKVIRWGL